MGVYSIRWRILPRTKQFKGDIFRVEVFVSPVWKRESFAFAFIAITYEVMMTVAGIECKVAQKKKKITYNQSKYDFKI
jgi:hypothetical protein